MSDRDEELRDLKERRKQAIFDKLRESGWSEELDNNDDYTLLHPYEAQLRQETSRTYRTNMEQHQAASDRYYGRVEGQADEKGTYFCAQAAPESRRHSTKGIFFGKTYYRSHPGASDICNMDEFKAIIEDTPIDVEVNEGSFEHAVARLPLLVERVACCQRRRAHMHHERGHHFRISVLHFHT
jgi:hypothetical protein